MAANVNVALRRLITVWQVGPLVGVLVFTALVQPRASHILFGLLALVFGANLASGGRVHAMFRPQGLLLASAAFAAYAFLNALWAPKPLAALGSAGLLLLYGLLAQVAANGIEREEAGAIERASHALIYAALGGAAFIAVEGLANQAIMRKLLTLLPMLRPADGGHVDVEGGVVTSIAAFMLKRNCSALLLILWPALLVLDAWSDRKRGMLLSLVLVALTGIAVHAAKHDTSVLALAVSIGVFVLARWQLGVARKGLLAAWCIATLLVVPIAQQAYGAKLYVKESIPSSARARIILWGFTAGEVHKSPWLGTGIGGAKAYFDRHMKDAPQPADHVYPLTTGPHSHNVYLQTWYELGLVGAVLLLACGVFLLGWIGRQSQELQPFILAGFAAGAASAASSWGMWQEWFQALTFLSMVLMCLAVQFGRRRKI